MKTMMQYRRCGNSGLMLPAISLGLWYNFGAEVDMHEQSKLIHSAFDAGITHFDLANNYGPPPGSAEENFGTILKRSLSLHRDEIIISTKAGYRMWPGHYGEWNSKKSLLASLDQSLKRLQLDYVDIFYSHRADANTPLEETVDALQCAVQQGKALYVGISSYSASRTRAIHQLLDKRTLRLLIHQPSYSLLNRWVETDLLDTLENLGVGCIAFSPLAQGLLSKKYLTPSPATHTRAQQVTYFQEQQFLRKEIIDRVKGLDAIAQKRGQTLAQMALSWVLRKPTVTSALIGVRNIDQLAENVDALQQLHFSSEECQEIDAFAIDAGINLWKASSDVQ